MKVLLITGEGYDDSEGLYPYYRLIEEGFEVVVASNKEGEVCAKYHEKLNVDLTFDKVNPSDYVGLVVPGGKAPEKLRLIDDVLNITKSFFDSNKPVCAICHGQQILISASVLRGRTATCYPGIKQDVINAGANYVDEKVVVDGNLVTSRRPQDLPFFMREFIKLLKK